MELDDATDACQLIARILKRNSDDRMYRDGVARYNSDPEFEALVTACCSGLGLNKPMRYDNDWLVLAPSGKDSPFAMGYEFFQGVTRDRPIVLAMIFIAIKLFWPDLALFGDHRESEWITDKEVGYALRDVANEINVSEKSASGSPLWQAVFSLRDRIESGTGNSRDLLGLAKKALNCLENAKFARKRETEEGSKYCATPWLCAFLQNPAWNDFEAFLTGVSDDSGNDG